MSTARDRIEEDLTSVNALLALLPADRVLERVGLEARREELLATLSELAPAEDRVRSYGRTVAILSDEIHQLRAEQAARPKKERGVESERRDLGAIFWRRLAFPTTTVVPLLAAGIFLSHDLAAGYLGTGGRIALAVALAASALASSHLLSRPERR